MPIRRVDLAAGLLVASVLAACGESSSSEAMATSAAPSNSSVAGPASVNDAAPIGDTAGPSQAAIPTTPTTGVVPSAGGAVPSGSSGAGPGDGVVVGGSGGAIPTGDRGNGGSPATGGENGTGAGGSSSSGGAAGDIAGGGRGGQAAGGGAGAETTGGGAGGSIGGAGGQGAGAAGGTAGAGGSDATSTTETLHYYGRWNLLADRAITVNTGSHVVAQFSGTEVRARFDVSLNQTPNPTLTWRIDDGDWQEGELEEPLTLATNLPDGSHEVTLMVRGLNENQSRWSPPLVSSITFLGFEVPDGMLEPSPRPDRPKIEFLGDSITEGINLWSSHNGQNTPCWRADGRRNYASLTAQALGAEWRQVGFGRQGLLIDGNGGVPPANEAFGFIYADVPRDDWQPDLVVINQGTNDGNAAANEFRDAYATFITTIRGAYPDANIAAMRPFNGAHAAEISADVDARNSAGDDRVFYIDTTGWLSSSDFTDSYHPNEQGSQKAAAALEAAIEALGLP